MRFNIAGSIQALPKLCDLIPGTMVVIDNVVYIKVDKQKKLFTSGNKQGAPRITWISDFCVLFNPDDGKLIQVCATNRYIVVEVNGHGEVEVVDISHNTSLNKYLRTTSPDIVRC